MTSPTRRRLVRAGVVVVVVAAMLLATGCGGSTRSAGAPVVTVETGLWPFAEAARAIGLGNVAVVDPVPPGVDARTWTPTTEEAAQIRRAGVVLEAGGGVQPGFERAAVANRARVELVGAVAPGAADVWLDPHRMQGVAQRIASALERADPRAASTFRTGLADWQSSVGALDASYQSTLSVCPVHRLLTVDAAFGVLAPRYGVTVEPLLDTVRPVGLPDAATVTREVAVIRASGSHHLYTDTFVPVSFVFRALAATGATVAGTLDSLEDAPARGAAVVQTYANLMARNLTVLTKGLSCPSSSTS